MFVTLMLAAGLVSPWPDAIWNHQWQAGQSAEYYHLAQGCDGHIWVGGEHSLQEAQVLQLDAAGQPLFTVELHGDPMPMLGIQAFVPGPDCSVWAVMQGGTLVGVISGRSPDHPERFNGFQIAQITRDGEIAVRAYLNDRDRHDVVGAQARPNGQLDFVIYNEGRYFVSTIGADGTERPGLDLDVTAAGTAFPRRDGSVVFFGGLESSFVEAFDAQWQPISAPIEVAFEQRPSRFRAAAIGQGDEVWVTGWGNGGALSAPFLGRVDLSTGAVTARGLGDEPLRPVSLAPLPDGGVVALINPESAWHRDRAWLWRFDENLQPVAEYTLAKEELFDLGTIMLSEDGTGVILAGQTDALGLDGYPDVIRINLDQFQPNTEPF